MRRLKTDDLAKFTKFQQEMDARRRSLPNVKRSEETEAAIKLE